MISLENWIAFGKQTQAICIRSRRTKGLKNLSWRAGFASLMTSAWNGVLWGVDEMLGCTDTLTWCGDASCGRFCQNRWYWSKPKILKNFVVLKDDVEQIKFNFPQWTVQLKNNRRAPFQHCDLSDVDSMLQSSACHATSKARSQSVRHRVNSLCMQRLQPCFISQYSEWIAFIRHGQFGTSQRLFTALGGDREDMVTLTLGRSMSAPGLQGSPGGKRYFSAAPCSPLKPSIWRRLSTITSVPKSWYHPSLHGVKQR
jgi:hypothetical protein